MADFPETPLDFGSIIPEDDPSFSASTALDEVEANLDDPSLWADVIDRDTLVVATEPQIYQPGRSWAFDFLERRFVSDATRARAPLATRGLATITTWIEKALRTDRGSLPIYTDRFGMEDPNMLIGEVLSPAVAATLTRRVRDALTYHPKIIDVVDFEVAVDPDDEEIVNVAATVLLDNGETVPFASRLT